MGCALFQCVKAVAQNDSINRLEEVVLVADVYVKEQVVGQKKVVLSKEEINNNITNPTETLRFNSPVSIRDYGNGGTSSARFRGTSASNTAVLWNGININAIGNGQTDLNSISINTSDQIVIKSGGGSVKYGSGAIGGSIHINDELRFKKHQNLDVYSSYSSFNTTSNYLKVNIGTSKWALKVGSTFNKSDNDYELIDSRYLNLKNENGAYQNSGVNLSVGYQFSKKNQLSFFTTAYKGERFLSGELPNPSPANDKYIDLNQRNLLVWNVESSEFKHLLKGAFLTQEYRYFDDKSSDKYDYGKSKTILFNYDLQYKLTEKTQLTSFVDVQSIKGDISRIPSKKREQYAFTLGVNSKITKYLETTIEVKKELNSTFKVPFVFSLGANYDLDIRHRLLTNISTNYRVPSLNDLYWPGQGNLNLIPETSKQIDLGYQYLGSRLLLKSMLFFTDVTKKIIWRPNKSGIWRPLNLNKSYHSGIELYTKLKKNIGDFDMNITGNYIYTIAQDRETNKELIFVPKHLFNGAFKLKYKSVTLYVQNLTQSKVFTTKDNIDQIGRSLNGFTVFNLGGNLLLFKTKNGKLKLGSSIKNVFNQLYLFSISRPMPGRNYNININYKF